MTHSYTTSSTQTFTLTHARELASRVIADLSLCAKLYRRPAADSLDRYRDELVQLLHRGYLDAYEFGFKRDDQRVLSWFYQVGPSGDVEGGSPGGLYARADIEEASYFNFVTYSQRWCGLDAAAKERFREGLPFRRGHGSAPVDGSGYWAENDRGYAAGGTLVTRRTFRPY